MVKSTEGVRIASSGVRWLSMHVLGNSHAQYFAIRTYYGATSQAEYWGSLNLSCNDFEQTLSYTMIASSTCINSNQLGAKKADMPSSKKHVKRKTLLLLDSVDAS